MKAFFGKIERRLESRRQVEQRGVAAADLAGQRASS
jgi:hypothetical protein